MLKKQYTFLHMSHSDGLESHANEKLEKLEKLLGDQELPQNLEVRFKSNPHGASNEVELKLSTKHFKNCFVATGADVYEALDEAIEKTTSWVKKEKDKLKTKHRKVKTAKSDF